jgi:hypothetical protein
MCNDTHQELYIDQRCSAVLPGNSPKKSAKIDMSPSWPIEKYMETSSSWRNMEKTWRKYGDIIISTILKTPKIGISKCGV